MCKVFKKRIATTMRKMDDSPCWYDDQVSFMQSELESPSRISSHHPYNASYQHQQQHYPCKQELDQLQYNIHINNNDANNFLQLPQLENLNSPMQCSLSTHSMTQEQYGQQQSMQMLYGGSNDLQAVVEQSNEWKALDKFVASRLSQDQDHASKGTSSYCNVAQQIALLSNDESKKSETGGQEHVTSISNSNCQIDTWK